MIAVQESLFAILSEKMGIPSAELRPDTTFEDLDLDSLALIELSVSIQKSFGVVVDEMELSPERRLGEVVAVIDAKARPA
ncbi:acyl carrier protein [Actinoplanes sp. TFC3]|uniref:acyl carrier protein n=1 Tax=Actinoplanes sp. TFC3 TaxID=1710355 RepID=UPI0009E8932E|nr:acyl carrier protein [Actinoplanes sp. TFC3]